MKLAMLLGIGLVVLGGLAVAFKGLTTREGKGFLMSGRFTRPPKKMNMFRFRPYSAA